MPSTRPGAHRSRVAGTRQGAVVLVVDDDASTRESARLLLQASGITVYEAGTGTAGVEVARTHSLDLAIIDNVLPDISGLDVARALRAERITVPWILASGHLTIPIAVEAMRLGAVNAVEMPFDMDSVVLPAIDAAIRARAGGWPRRPLTPRLRDPKSAAERCARLILRACDAEADPHTLQEWASEVAVGYSTLTEACRLAGVEHPHDARDFMRVLRMLLITRGGVACEAHLHMGDSRTVEALVERAGLASVEPGRPLAFDEFLVRQQFIPVNHPVVAALKTLVADCGNMNHPS